MKLKILEHKILSPLSYRGVNRADPFYVDSVPDTHEVNQAFLHYLDIQDEQGLVTDLDFCRHVIEVYKHWNPPQDFEIVEITQADQAPEYSMGTCLGFDIAFAAHHSLLSEGLLFDNIPNPGSPADGLQDLLPLIKLVKDYFRPKLNENKLFADRTVAGFCLEAMLALQKIKPGLWENDQFIFEVIGIWKVD